MKIRVPKDSVVRTCLVLLTGLALVWSWYEFTGARADTDEAYRDYYASNSTTKYNVMRQPGLCANAGTGENVPCPEYPASHSFEVERDPVNWFHLHLGALLSYWLVWAASLALLLVGVYRVRGRLDEWFPVRPDLLTQAEMVSHLVRTGFVMVWMVELGIIWTLILFG